MRGGVGVEVEYLLYFRQRRFCRRAVGVGTLRGGLRSAVPAGRAKADKPIRTCFSGSAVPQPATTRPPRLEPTPTSQDAAWRRRVSRIISYGAGSRRRIGQARPEIRRMTGSKPDPEQGHPSGKGRPPREVREQPSDTHAVMSPPRWEARKRRRVTGRGGPGSFHWPPADQKRHRAVPLPFSHLGGLTSSALRGRSAMA